MARFQSNPNVFFGKTGHIEALTILKSEKGQKIGFLIDRCLSNLPIMDDIVEQYAKNGFVIDPIQEVTINNEPTYKDVDIYSSYFKGKEIDALAAFGGGSAMDIAKGISILLTNSGKSIEYRGMNKVKRPGIPLVCYPSTAGTGSEVTHTASLIDSNSMIKMGINGRYITPYMGIHVPELTYSCPRGVTIASGLDAMIHATEAISAKNSNAITEMIGAQAFSLLFENLPKVLEEPNNYSAREKMLLGSYLAGMAMINAGGGIASGLSYPIGTHWNVPHGVAGGVLLPHAIEYNVMNGYNGYAIAYDHLDKSEKSLSVRDKNLRFVESIKYLYNKINAPNNYSHYGISNGDIDAIIELAIQQRRENLNLNPVPLGELGLREILHKVIH